jgi:hypothetical protein
MGFGARIRIATKKHKETQKGLMGFDGDASRSDALQIIRQ